MLDWKKIEEEFALWHLDNKGAKSVERITEWFKNRIESYQIVSVEPLTQEEREDFYTTNVTAEITPKYGKS